MKIGIFVFLRQNIVHFSFRIFSLNLAYWLYVYTSFDSGEHRGRLFGCTSSSPQEHIWNWLCREWDPRESTKETDYFRSMKTIYWWRIFCFFCKISYEHLFNFSLFTLLSLWNRQDPPYWSCSCCADLWRGRAAAAAGDSCHQQLRGGREGAAGRWARGTRAPPATGSARTSPAPALAAPAP